jgi:hypothetical protein
MGQPLVKPAPRHPRRVLPIVLSIVGFLAVVAIVGVFGVLPVVLKQQVIASAASQGVTLTVDHVAIGIGDVRLMSVTLALDGVPQLKTTADSVQVTLVGLAPGPAAVSGIAMTLDGPLEDLQKALATWGAARARTIAATPASANGAQPVTWALGHLTWTRAFGQTAKIEMTNLEGDVDPVKGTSRLSSDHATVTAGAATFGPWRVAVERDAQTARIDVELDPVVQGGPSVVFVRDSSNATSLKVSVPTSPLSRLGVPAKSVGLAADSSVEADIDFEVARTGAATLKGTVDLTRAVFGGVPIDAKLVLAASGDTTKGLDVKQGSLTAGPLKASVTGTVKLFDDGIRLALAWRSTPVSCAEIGKQMATQALGQLGGQLGSIVGDLGGAIGVHVAGEAAASGLITLDSRDVNAASFTLTTNDTCGLALF